MKADYGSDAEMEANLHRLRVSEPNMRCPSDHRIARMCINPACKLSLICNEAECKSCEDAHDSCPSVRLPGVTNLINGRVDKYKEFISEGIEIEISFMKEIQEARSQLNRKFILGNF